MMDNTWFLIWHGDTRWTVRSVVSGEQRAAEFQAEGTDAVPSVAEHLRRHGYAGQPVVLGIPSDQCMAAPISINKKQRDHETLLFAIEEKLPRSAEQLVADFVFSKNMKSALGVAVETAELLPLMASLEQAGLAIAEVVPTSLLALQPIMQDRAGSVAYLWQAEERVEMFFVHDGRLVDWRLLPADSMGLRREKVVRTRQQLPEVTIAIGFDDEDFVRTAWCGAIEFVEHDRLARACEAVARVRRGSEPAIVDLRRDQLRNQESLRPFNDGWIPLTVVACLALIVLGIALQWRAHRYRIAERQLEVVQADVFQQAFPGQRVPLGVRARLESELAKLSADGAPGDQATITPQVRNFEAVLRALPRELQSAWEHVRVSEPGDILLEGQLGSAAEAETVRRALAEAGFEVESLDPTPLKDEHVAVRVRARRKRNDG